MTIKAILTTLLLTSTLAFAGVHGSCHSDTKDSRIFAVAYVAAIIDLKGDETTSDGQKVYQMPALDYSQAFDAVCAEIDKRPELWERPSREAVIVAVDALWRRRKD
jgi:hypothetical protein